MTLAVNTLTIEITREAAARIKYKARAMRDKHKLA